MQEQNEDLSVKKLRAITEPELVDKIEIVNDLQKRWRDSSPFAPRTAGRRLKSD